MKIKTSLLVLSIVLISKTFAAVWYVNDNSTTGDIYCSAVGNDANPGTSASPKLTLGAAVAAATSGDIIYIDAGTYTDTEINFRPTSGTNIFTITGAGADLTIFDGSAYSKKFEYSTYTWELTISDLTIDNYYASTGSAAFDIIANRKLTLNDVVISNSRNGQAVTLSVGSSSTSLLSVTGGGFFCNTAGAIIVSGGYSGSGSLTLTDVAFINNSGLSYGSAICIGTGFGFSSTPGSVTKLKKCVISGCLFDSNTGTNTSTVYIYNSCSSGCGTDNVDYLIENCIFRNNTVSTGGSSYGGTLSMKVDNNSWLINHCLFESNVNAASLGTIAIHTGNVDITNSKFQTNTTTSSEGKDLFVHRASATQEGASYYLNDPIVDVNNCFFLSASDNISKYTAGEGTINLIESGTPTNTSDYSGDGLSQTYTWVDVDELLWTGDCGSGYTLSSGDYYWIGGSGNWTDYSNHWSTTSGGSADQTAYPTSTANVYFDANSDIADAAFIVTMDVNGETKNFNYNSDYGTFTTSSSKTLSTTNLYLTGGNLTIDNVTTSVSTINDINSTLTLNTAIYNGDGTFDATGGIIDFTGAGQLILSGNVISLGTLDSSEGTVEYDGGTQTVISDSYFNLNITSVGTKTANGNIDVNGDFSTAATATCKLDMSSYDLNVAANFTVGATDGLDLSDASALLTLDGTVNQTITHAGNTGSGELINESAESGLGVFSTSGNVSYTTSSTYYKTGSNCLYNDYTSSNTSYLTLSSNLDLSTATTATLSFYHIAKTEGGWDKCYIEYSDNGGSTWTVFPNSKYTGSSLDYSTKVYFHEDSYTDWGTSTETPVNNSTWWKFETFDMSFLVGQSDIKIRFKLTSDSSSERYGWLIDDVIVSYTGGSGFQANDLTINKSSGNIILSSEFTVNGTLTLTSGDIDASSFDLILTSNAGVSGTSNSSHVIGTIQKTINAISSFTFPTGDGTIYRPIIISPSTPTSTLWTANYVNTGHPDTDVDGSGLDHILQQEYWNLSRDVATDATVGLTWTSANNLTDYSQLRIAHYDGTTDWDMIASTPIGDNTSGTITSNADVTTFSPFTLGSATSANPLPIKLISFKGFALNNSENKLEWSTLTEQNSDFITIEKSTDGLTFDPIGFQKLAGNSLSKINYNYIDRNVESKINYYRLKQFDIDGKYDYSKIISIDNRNNNNRQIIQITNLIGQQVDQNYKGLVIIQYSDGTSEKTIQ